MVQKIIESVIIVSSVHSIVDFGEALLTRTKVHFLKKVLRSIIFFCVSFTSNVMIFALNYDIFGDLLNLSPIVAAGIALSIIIRTVYIMDRKIVLNEHNIFYLGSAGYTFLVTFGLLSISSFIYNFVDYITRLAGNLYLIK